MPVKQFSKRAEIRAKNRRSETQQRVIFIVLAALFALVVTFFIVWPKVRPVGEISMPVLSDFSNANQNTLGDPNAPVRIDEYADFQCPACEYFFVNIFPQLKTEYIDTGKVYFVSNAFSFIDDNSVTKESDRAAEAAYCAMDQNNFWQFTQMLYANQTGENIGDYTDRRLQSMAEKLGLDMDLFNSCFTKNKYASQVLTERQAGEALEVNSTPSFVINGQLHKLKSYDQFFQAIDEILAVK